MEEILLDIGVGARDVGLGLVVVVIGDEILDRVLREEALELAIELGGERLVWREHEGRALRRLDHLGHGEGLARTRDAEQHLVALMRVDLGHELGDGRGLIALRRELGLNGERHAALALLRARRPMRHEIGPDLAGHQRMVLHERLRGLAEAGRAAVRAQGQAGQRRAIRRQAGRLARDGARLGARAKGLRSTIGHRPNMAAGRGLG